MLKLYENIKRCRVEAKLTQEELARLAGYTDRSSIAKIEKGVVDLPQSKVKQFAEIFGTTPGHLMGIDAEPEDLGAMAADVLKDPTTLTMLHDYQSLSAADQYTVRLLVASLASKNKKD